MAKKLNIEFEKLLELAYRIDFFSAMEKKQSVSVLKQLKGDLYLYNRQEKIINEGDEDHTLFIILSGEVSVEKGSKQFSALGTLIGGDFFGEISFIRGTKRMTSVFAQKETIALQLSQKKFTVLDLEVQILIKDKVIEKLITRLNDMNAKVLDLRNLPLL